MRKQKSKRSPRDEVLIYIKDMCEKQGYARIQLNAEVRKIIQTLLEAGEIECQQVVNSPSVYNLRIK